MVLFLGFLTSGTTYAAVGSSSGTLHFTGAIVESGCAFDTTKNNVTSQCYRSGEAVSQTQAIGSKNLPHFSLPQSYGQVTTRHINNDPHLVLMTVSYN